MDASEVGSAVGDRIGATFFLEEIASTLPDSFELLKDPESWIGDSGASRHSNFSSIGIHNNKEGSMDDKITVGNGETFDLGAVGDLKVTVCNKLGVQMSEFASHLCTSWGEARTVTLRNSRSSKLVDCGVQCMFVG
jgi:hypothetical protein